MAVGLVGRAGFIGDVVAVDEVVCAFDGTAVAASVGVIAGDKDLRSDEDVGERGVTSDFNAIGECRGRCECPAGATVLWDVLVFSDSEEVASIDVAPVEGGREGGSVETRGFYDRWDVVLSDFNGKC